MADYEALISRYRNGEEQALEQLIEDLRRPLYGFIYQMIQGLDDADDIYQETWARAIRQLPRFRGGNFRAWLFRIARNLVIDRARQRRIKPSANDDNRLAAIPDEQPTPADNARNSEIAERIRYAVEQLPLEQREVFVLRTQSELSFREIAQIQKVSINTALARMQYALRRLRRDLADLYETASEDQI